MIQRVQSSPVSYMQYRSNSQPTTTQPEAQPIPADTTPQDNKAIMQNALSNIAFGSIQKAGAVVEKFQVTVPNIFDLKESNILEASGEKGQNRPVAIIRKRDKDNQSTVYNVHTDGNLRKALRITKNNAVHPSKLPIVSVKSGKFDPMAVIEDREIGIKIQVLPGASAKISDKFSILNQGDVITGETKKPISFQGRTQVVVYNQEKEVHKVSEDYAKSGLHKNVPKGDFASIVEGDNATTMVLAGGYGTRLYDFYPTKPAAPLPTNPLYRLMCNALDQSAKSSTAEKMTLEYLSGQNTISGPNIYPNIQETNLGDGGCIAKALALGTTPTDVPLIILNADTITNADITRAYKQFHDNKDAAILIPYYEAPESRISGFGLMTAEATGSDNSFEIKAFVEKPKTLKEAESAKIVGKERWRANPGIYILGPDALKELKKIGEQLLENPKEVGLAKDFITPLVAKCQKGEFRDADGNAMKCYTAPLERKGGGAAFWDDLGTSGTIPQTFRYMAAETRKYGANNPKNLFYGLSPSILNDAVRNVDAKTGVTYMNKGAKAKLEQFEAKYGKIALDGNCIVYNIDAA